jgi:hypothetical protein
VNRPGVSIRTRSGYYAGETRAASNKPSVVTPETVSALEGILPRSDVPLTVNVLPFATPGKQSTIAVVLGVRQAGESPRTNNNEPVNVLVAAFDRSGRSVQSEHQTVGMTLLSNSSGGVSYELLSRLALKPGRYEVRASVDVAPGRSGSVYTYVEVPDFAEQPLSLSGIVLSVAPAWPTAPPQGFPDLSPIVPTTRRDFTPTDRVSAFIRVYQKASEPSQLIDVKAQITDVTGKVVTTDAASFGAEQFTQSRSADYRVRLPVDRLSPGAYLLTLDAVRGQHSVRRTVRFQVH